MRRLRIHPILFGYLVLLLTASLLVACDEEQVVPPPTDTVLASGLVLDMPLQTPLAGATVQLITNEFQFLTDMSDPTYEAPCECVGELCEVNTTSDTDGWWEMEVPVKYDEMLAPLPMLMKVSKGTAPPQYNLFQTPQGDLQLLSNAFFTLFAVTSDAGLLGLLGGQLSVFLGVAIGFVDTNYPQEIASIPGVTVTAEGGDPEVQFGVIYLADEPIEGLPDPSLTETSSLGVYYFSVPDANEAPSIKVSGDKPGSTFVGSFFPACPGSSTGAAVIDPFFQPLEDAG